MAAIERFADEHEIPVVRFRKGESKEETARTYFECADRERRTGVVPIGVAQEKASAWRGWRDGGPDGHPHFCFGRQTVFVNHYELTPDGRRLAVFFTKTYNRILNPSLAELDPKLPTQVAARSALARGWRSFERALDERIKQAAIAA